MAQFRALVPVNFVIEGISCRGPAGTVFEIPDELAPSVASYLESAVRGFEWVLEDEMGALEARVAVLESGSGGPAAHPDLAAHDLLGLATQTELNTHASALDPHPNYALDADLVDHEGEGHVHNHDVAYEPAGAVSSHVASADPHPLYLTAAEHTESSHTSMTSLATQAELDAHAATSHGAPLDFGEAVDITTSGFGDVVAAGATGEIADAGHRHAREANPVTVHVGEADPHLQYQKESEKAVASGYPSLDASVLVPVAQMGVGTPDGTKFLRDDRAWVTPSSAPSPDSRLITRALTADQADITGITLVNLASLAVTGLGIGTYQFCYQIIYQTTATTTGVEFVVVFSGTSTAFVSNMMFGSTGGAAATGIADQVGVGTAAGLMEVKTARALNTRPGVTIGVDTANANMLMTIEGVLVVSAAGDLNLQMAAELASLVVRAKAGSSLVLVKVA